MKFRAVNRVVFTDIYIVRTRRNGQVGAIGDIGEGFVLGGGENIHLAENPGFLSRFFRPHAREYVIRFPVFHQIHRHHRKLRVSAALQKQNFILLGNIRKRAKFCFRFRDDFSEILASVTHFHHGHSRAAIVEHFLLRLFEHLQRQLRRSG